MFPSQNLPVAEALWRHNLAQASVEALLTEEEARYAAKLEAIRNRAPQAQPIGFDVKAQQEEANAQEAEEQDEMEEDEEEFTDDDGPADRF
mmetsp:Transcript_40408/g.72589  ORF Transcript_40408/g.72589 Transcript_40408/m.72589 type:complete len:91 (-) Transcript_40408:94-366(-)|eukprot:CAMPEP_0197664712 /NCGR_PEP_ID=MMETSP1338-20131121/58804_1 /TAXON_ID=43686 ORGANISM="Pelagodinium beii, Strain RCC1491" /NCGR_SAMPLE_ID=MMETSP1338 /ASSEMBLY_ACC=CAM_ASM_000754 /LENGTH=90 /DNA_ID=CAMNT_0043243407 /DNA_START=21 /DNA_END=293 /DNA_ORIENTATION=-